MLKPGSVVKILFVLGLLASQICSQQLLADSTQRPELVESLSSTSKAKIFLAKKSYRFEELMMLDVGLLISAKSPVFVPSDLNYRVLIKDGSQKNVYLNILRPDDRLPKFNKQSTGIVKHSLVLLVGCENTTTKEFERAMEGVDNNDPADLFERSLFRTVPDACINIDKPTQLDVSVEVFNDWVVDGTSIKTVVGEVTSNTLRVVVERP